MSTLIRTILILVACFLTAQALPKNAQLIPFLLILVAGFALLDFILFIITGEELGKSK